MLEMFGFTFHLYGFILAIAIASSVWLTEKIIHREKIALHFEKVAALVILCGVIGARVYHVVTDWHLYAAEPWKALFIWHGGLGVIGAVVGGVIGLWLAVQLTYQQHNFLRIVESAIITVPLGQAIGRWANFFNQELFGRPTTLPWGVFIDPLYRPTQFGDFERFHPLFLYESILCLGLFLVLLFCYSKKKWQVGQGKYFAIYCIGYSMIRWGLEFLRIDSARVSSFGWLSIAQWVMVGAFMFGWYLFLSPQKR